MGRIAGQTVLDFDKYPSVGREDVRYTYATAFVRAMQAEMLSTSFFVEMVNAESFAAAVDMLSSTEYAVPQGSRNFSDVEDVLFERRSYYRTLLNQLLVHKELAELFKTRLDAVNMKLALRRKLTDKPLGIDYSDEGNVPAAEFEDIFEKEDYTSFPMHMREAIERAVLSYYQHKDIRQIDYALDAAELEYRINRAEEVDEEFFAEYFRMRADLVNITTSFRLKFAGREEVFNEPNVFINGGYVSFDMLKHVMDVTWDGIPAIFSHTPYFDVVESGVHYIAAHNSFLRLEANIDKHIEGFFDETSQISAGPQPVVAFFLKKEKEIRYVRLVLTANKNELDNRLVLDRIGV